MRGDAWLAQVPRVDTTVEGAADERIFVHQRQSRHGFRMLTHAAGCCRLSFHVPSVHTLMVNFLLGQPS